MKYVLILAIAALGLTGCGDRPSSDSEVGKRIKFKYSNNEGQFQYEIIEVDGIEYLTSSRGGIYPLVKDTTAKKIVFKINQ
jgi:hypothetical protein